MVITIPETKRVNVLRVKITVSCKECKTEWAVTVNEDGSLKNGWNLCRKCSLEKKFNIENSIGEKETKENDITNTEAIGS